MKYRHPYTLQNVFTKEQLAYWESLNFPFPDEYSEWANQADKQREDNKMKLDAQGSIVSGYWSSDSGGKRKILKSKLGQTVYFHLQTAGIPDNKTVILQLFDKDEFFDDDIFPTVKLRDGYKSITEKKIIKKVRIKHSQASFALKLDETWKTMISEDFYNNFLSVKIELFWKGTIDGLTRTIPAVLQTFHSPRDLYFEVPVAGYSLPELLTSTGATIIFAIGESAEMNKHASEFLDNCRYFI